MFEKHFGLRENPFHSGHQLRFLYPSREHQEARAHLRYGIENREPFVLITGEVGTGKTTALYDALAEWGNKVAVALITNSALTRQELIEEIGLRFGLTVPPGASKPQALALLERHLTAVRARGEYAVLLLDEAQNLAPELLEEIRLLSNLEVQGEKLVQIFLVGQPELEAKLADVQLRQLRQRISVHYRLNPLSPEETTAYIHHRVAVAGGNPWATFPPETCREVYRITHGIPREINTVASQALIAAFSENATTVQPGHVHAIHEEAEFRSVLGAPASDAESARALHVAPPPAAMPAPAPPAPPAPAAADAAPAWTPPELAAVPMPPPPPLAMPPAPAQAVPEAVQAVDAWTAAAQGLMEARRRGIVPEGERHEPARVEVVSSFGAEQGAHQPEPAQPERFPTPAELYARAEEARPDNADLSGLPERLREKIAADIAAEEAREAGKRRMVPVLLGAVILVALAGGAAMLQHFQVIDVPALRAFGGGQAPDSTAHASAVPAQPAAVPTPAPAPAVADTMRTAAAESVATAPAPAPKPAQPPAPSKPLAATTTASTAAHTTASAATVPPATLAATTPATKPAAAATTAPPKPAPSATTAPTTSPATAPATSATPKPASTAPANGPVYGIGVGSYLDRGRADEESAKLASKSGLPTTVVPVVDGGTTKFRVVLGHYASNGAAENASLELMDKLHLSEARPVLLSRGKAR